MRFEFFMVKLSKCSTAKKNIFDGTNGQFTYRLRKVTELQKFSVVGASS